MKTNTWCFAFGQIGRGRWAEKAPLGRFEVTNLAATGALLDESWRQVAKAGVKFRASEPPFEGRALCVPWKTTDTPNDWGTLRCGEFMCCWKGFRS